MAALTDTLVQIAGQGWPIIAALLLQLVALRLLTTTGKQFQTVTTGHATFDLQNKLTPVQIAEQLPTYTPDSKRIYGRFFVIDFFFPLFASLFLSLLWAALLPRPEAPMYQQLLRWNLPLLAFLPAFFDWGENVCFLILIQRYPPTLTRLTVIAIGFKRLKLATLYTAFGITLVLLVFTVVLWVQVITR